MGSLSSLLQLTKDSRAASEWSALSWLLKAYDQHFYARMKRGCRSQLGKVEAMLRSSRQDYRLEAAVASMKDALRMLDDPHGPGQMEHNWILQFGA